MFLDEKDHKVSLGDRIWPQISLQKIFCTFFVIKYSVFFLQFVAIVRTATGLIFDV